MRPIRRAEEPICVRREEAKKRRFRWVLQRFVGIVQLSKNMRRSGFPVGGNRVSICSLRGALSGWKSLIYVSLASCAANFC